MSIGTPDIRQLRSQAHPHTATVPAGSSICGRRGRWCGNRSRDVEEAVVGSATTFCGFLTPARPTQQSGNVGGYWRSWNIGLEDERWIPGCRSRYQLDNDGPATIMRFTLTLCAAALVAPSLAAAQPAPVSDWPIAPGSRVRILSPVLGKRYVTGNVVAATSDTLVFRAAAGTPLRPRSQRRTSSGSTSRAERTPIRRDLLSVACWSRYFCWEAAIGNASSKPSCTNCLDYTQGATALGYGLLGGLVGGFAGAAFGSRPTETWVPVTLPAR